jgi:hypothetical protein
VTLEEILLQIWRQTLVEGTSEVELDGRRLRVRATAKRRLKEVDFSYEGRSLRGIEQNPETASRWAEMARKGAKIMQFTEVTAGEGQAPATAGRRGRFFANVADGKVNWYRRLRQKTK